MTTLTVHRSDGVTPSAVQWQRCNVDGELCVDLAGETGITYEVDDVLDLSVRVIADDRTSDVWFPAAASPPPGDFYIHNGFEGGMQAALTTSPWYIAYNNDYNIFDSAKWKAVTPGADGTGQAVGLTVTSSQTTYGTTNLGPLVFAGVDTDAAHTVNGTTTWYSWKFKLPSAECLAGYGEYMWFAEWHEASPGIGVSTGFGFLDYHDGFGNPTATRNNIQLRFRPGGGSTDSPTYEDWVAPWPSEVMQLDGWYKVVIGITWDTVASNAGGTGQFELYITKPDSSPLVLRQNVGSSNGDGSFWTNPHPFPTLYHVPSTSEIDRPSFGFYNYRRALASGSSRIDVDESYIGPTRASVDVGSGGGVVPAGYYIYDSLNDPVSSPWQTVVSAPQGGTADGSIDWSQGSFVRLHTPPATDGPSGTTGELVSVYLNNADPNVHTSEGESTWYRCQWHVPADYVATSGNWNFILEWHIDGGIVSGTGVDSMCLGIITDGAIPGPGTNPRLFFRTQGGPDNAPESHEYRLPSNSLLLNHTYDVVVNVTWGVDSSAGRVRFWLDGVPFAGVGSLGEGAWSNPVSHPTLFYDSGSLTRDQPGFGMYLYHIKVNHALSHDFDEVYIGPTAASVGFVP